MHSILIVEDEYLVRVGLHTCINWESHGFVLLEDAFDGMCAYEMITQLRPDIILLDIKMPRLNGFELLERLKKEGLQVNVIILSCCDDFESVRKALHLGVIDYINKLTLNPDDLLSILAKVKLPSSGMLSAPTSVTRSQNASDINMQKLFSEFVNKKCLPEDLHKLFMQGYFACVQFKSNISDKIISPHICLTMTVQILKNSGISCLASCNEHGTVCLLLPSSAKSSSVAIAFKNNIEFNLNTVCSVGFSPLINSVDDFVLYYQMALQIEDFEFFEFSGFVKTFTSIIVINDEIEKKFLQIKQSLNTNLAALSSIKIFELLDFFANKFCFSNVILPKHFIKYALSLLDVFRIEPLADSYFYYQNEIVKANYASHVLESLRSFAGLYFNLASTRCLKATSPIIEKAIDYIIANSSRFICLTEVAANVNVSESYLSQLFKKETGENFVTYIHRYKINLAKTMLDTNMLVYEVCDKIGFENPNYFSKIFKRYVGVSPNEYKRNKFYGSSKQ